MDNEKKVLDGLDGELEKAERSQLVSQGELETPQSRAEREIELSICSAGEKLRSLLTQSVVGLEIGEANAMKVQLTAALAVLDRANAIKVRQKPAADGGNVLSTLSMTAYRNVLAKRMQRAKVVEVQPIAAEAEGCTKIEAEVEVKEVQQPVAAAKRPLGVIPRG